MSSVSLVELWPSHEAIVLMSRTRASAGDTVITRRNDRTLRAGDGSCVKNGDRWHLVDVHRDGAVTVERHDHRTRAGAACRVTLPAKYVAAQVQLGYASAIHGAQDATVDTTHTVLTGTETRQGVYVALSRGRQTNHLYLGNPAPTLDGVGPEVHEMLVDPREVLTDILARDGRAQSATTVERGDAARDLRQAALAYQDALPVLAQQHLGTERMAALDDALDRWIPGLTQQPADPHLRGQLALRWVDGTHPETVVEQATWYRGTQALTEADDPAAALAWRIAGTSPLSHRDAPLPWLPDIPHALREAPETNGYLDRLTHQVDDLKHRVAGEAQHAGAAHRAPWQRSLPPDVDDRLIGDLAVWRAAYGIPPTEPSLTGPPMKNSTPPGTRPDSTGDSARRLQSPAGRRQTLSGRSYESVSDKLSVTGSTNVPHTTYPALRGDRSLPALTPATPWSIHRGQAEVRALIRDT